MREVFLTIVRMGLVSGYAVLVVLLVRHLLRRFPKRYSYLLWSVVFLRLVCPVGIEGAFSLVPDILFVDADAKSGEPGIFPTPQPFLEKEGGRQVLAAFYSAAGKAYSNGDTDRLEDAGDMDTNHTANNKKMETEEMEKSGNYVPDNLPHHHIPENETTGRMQENLPSGQINIPNSALGTIKDRSRQTISPQEILSVRQQNFPAIFLNILCVLWIGGILLFWVIWARSIKRFRRRLVGAVRVEKNVYESDSVTASFVDGIFHPVIYLAPGLSGAAREYVLCHERVHIGRRDPQIKAAALFLVSIYWFHPLVWLAFKKMCEDMEMSCDERVVELLGVEIKKEYSRTLLKMARGADEVGLLAAFGGNEVKSRVKNVLSYRKPKTWLAILLLVIVAAVGIGLGLNPGGKNASAAGKNAERQSDPDSADVPETGNSDREDVPDRIKEKSGITQYEYPAEFSMGENLKMAITQLALAYDHFDAASISDKGWKEIFVARFIQNSRASFDYLDLLSEKNDGRVDAEELYYIHYSLTGMELDFSSYAGGAVNRYDDASAFNYGSISGWNYRETENGGSLTIDFEIGFDGSDRTQKRKLTVSLTKNPYSCFDGYSIVSITSETAADLNEKYSSILTAYYTALQEKLSQGELMEQGFSNLAAYYYGEDMMEKIGYAFLDLDGDGTDELLIGAIEGDDFIRQQIFNLYYLNDDLPWQGLSGTERDRYYLCREGGNFIIINEGSSSASNTVLWYYTLREGELVPMQTIVYIAENDREGQWSYAAGEDAVLNRRATITEEEAQKIIRTYDEYRITPEYIPFSDFDPKKFDSLETEGDNEGKDEKTGKKVSGESLENQIDLIFRQREVWEQTDEFIAEETHYTVVDLNGNGRLELIAASCQGTGHYTYANIYEVSEDGNSLVPFTHTTPEGDSQADIIWGVAPVYYSQEENIYRYVFDDLVRNGAAYYYESKKSLELKENQIVETTLAYRITEYVNGAPVVTYGGGMEEILVTNEQEYADAADKTFEGWQKGMAYFLWFTAPEQGEDIEWLWYKRLITSYRSFSIVSEHPDPLALSGQESVDMEAEFLQSWKKEAEKAGYLETDALNWYEKFQRENIPLEPGDVVSALHLEDYNGDGAVDCFLAVSKYGHYFDTKWDGTPCTVVWGNINGKFCQIALWDEPVIAMPIIAGDINHDGFMEIVVRGDTGACGLPAVRPHWMFSLRDGEIQKMKLPSQRDYDFSAGIGGYEISVYPTEDDSICRAVLEQDGREVLFTVFDEQREENYTAKLDEAVPGWRDNKEGFGGNGKSYFDLEIITQDGKEYLVGREYLFIFEVSGTLGRANLVFDWNENGDVYIKDFYVEPSV